MRYIPIALAALLFAAPAFAFEAKFDIEPGESPTTMAEVLAEVATTGEKITYFEGDQVALWDKLAMEKASMGPIPGIAVVFSLGKIEEDVNGVDAVRVFVVTAAGELRYNKLFEIGVLKEIVDAINSGDA